jgi:hypothetical protein
MPDIADAVSTPRYGFQVHLDVRLRPDRLWEVLTPIRYLSALTQKAYTIEKGFCFDFASVPRLPLAYWLTGNTAHLASLVHDYLYQHPEIEPKETADAIFAEIMDAGAFWAGGPYDSRSGEPAWRGALMWTGVAVFGPSHYWNKDSSPAAGFAIDPPGD